MEIRLQRKNKVAADLRNINEFFVALFAGEKVGRFHSNERLNEFFGATSKSTKSKKKKNANKWIAKSF